jgi:hypothetical protein
LRQAPYASYVIPSLPSEEEAYQLLDSVLFYFGETQHLFDARDASDQLAIIYEDPQESLQSPGIGFLQALLIFAIGRLLCGESDGSNSPPGYALFKYALDLLPCPSELRAHGVAGIEVLAIITVYLQNIDRRDDAASYVRVPSARPPGYVTKPFFTDRSRHSPSYVAQVASKRHTPKTTSIRSDSRESTVVDGPHAGQALNDFEWMPTRP